MHSLLSVKPGGLCHVNKGRRTKLKKGIGAKHQWSGGAAEKWKNEFTFDTKSLSLQTINGRPFSGFYQRGTTVF